MENMTANEYFNRVLPYYKSMYDMEIPCMFGGVEYMAHGHFYSHSEKYVLSREAKLWESNNFEHAFFLNVEKFTDSALAEMDRIIRECAEPDLVRKGKPLPDRNHMYTYLTFVFLCDSPLEKELIRSIKKYHFTRNYLFTIRGWCEVRVVAVDLKKGVVHTNKAGSALEKLYRSAFEKGRQDQKQGRTE